MRQRDPRAGFGGFAPGTAGQAGRAGEPFAPPESDMSVSRDEWRAMALAAALDAAVPAKMRRMADWTPQQRIHYARNRWAPMQADMGKNDLTGGADLMYGGEHYVHEFTVLVGVLAALAYQPGGVNFAGTHWCADHDACEKAISEAANG